jgi:hypothetical protein
MRIISRWFSSAILTAAILIAGSSIALSQELQHRPPEQNPRVVACTVMETHASKEPAASVVLFHQANRADANRLQSLLRGVPEGGTVEFQVRGAEEWHSATVARMKSCFGRGLLILPAGVPALAEGASLLVRFPVQ